MNTHPAASDAFSVAAPSSPCLVIAHDPAINYAFQQNAIPVVKELRFQNDGIARKDLVIRVSAEPNRLVAQRRQGGGAAYQGT
jgi:hypothetical protein